MGANPEEEYAAATRRLIRAGICLVIALAGIGVAVWAPIVETRILGAGLAGYVVGMMSNE